MKCPACTLVDKNCPICYGTGYALVNKHVDSNECYTPPLYIKMVREVMGSINLDPASHPDANRVVQAVKIYTRQDNGLSKSWFGNVFLNPPYSRINGGTYQELFIGKAVEEYESGNIDQIIMLLHGLVLYNRYAIPLFAWPICIVHGTINFIKGNGQDGHDGRGNIFVYMGRNCDVFTKVFRRLGPIVTGVD